VLKKEQIFDAIGKANKRNMGANLQPMELGVGKSLQYDV
jgi:hypothetical protein